MKKTTIIAILFFNLAVYAQKNKFQIHYGIAESEFLSIEAKDGTGSQDVENFNEFGFTYSRELIPQLALETGMNYTTANVSTTPAFMGEPVTSSNEEFELITIPLLVNFTFWNYFFVNGGTLIDFEQSNISTNAQSGIGFSFGFGAKYSLNNIVLSINPNFKRHAIFPFEIWDHYQKLTELGVRFGLGYRF